MVLPQLVGLRFQILFHSPPGVLFTFPSRYLFTIGCQVVFSLGRWSSQIPTGFLVSRGTWELCPGRTENFAYRTITLFGSSSQRIPLSTVFVTSRGNCNFLQQSPSTPKTQRLQAITRHRFGLIPVRSPLLRESQLLSLPEGT